MGDQTFSVADPELRNTLARHLAATISLSLLWSHVQTFYFQLALPLSSYTVSVLLLLLFAAVLFVSCFLKIVFSLMHVLYSYCYSNYKKGPAEDN